MAEVKSTLYVSTNFISGGGTVKITNENPITIRLVPHNEGDGGWSQVWWYFKINGIVPGQEITIELDRSIPKCEGISPQAFFSHDQVSWGLTDIGMDDKKEGRDFFIYKHKARSNQIWFSYDLPYTPKNTEELIGQIRYSNRISSFELCKTKNGRPVKAIKYDSLNPPKYGIWLQARAHAFESGSSWVLHELAIWLQSTNAKAIDLRKNVEIYVVPIVDVDAVVEGRTGKYQKPYDHWMDWDKEPEYWVEIKTIKSYLRKMNELNRLDLFIGFHGPGAKSNPFFLTPFTIDLPYEKQRKNRLKFYEALNSESMTDETKLSESMTQILYSEREWDETIVSSSHEWVTMRTNDHCIAMTLEVNMNTPLSTQFGYRAESVSLGESISEYFVNNYHQK